MSQQTEALTYVDGGALRLALNVLRRAGKNEVADALESTAFRSADLSALPAEGAELVTDEQVADAIESEFSASGEWPESDAAVVRAWIKYGVKK